MARLYLMIIIVSLLGGAAFGAKTYYDWSQETITTLRENNLKLKSAAETLQNTVNQMAADAEKNEALNRQLTQELQASREYLNTLRAKFARIDLNMEAITNPQGLEERVDRAVQRLIDDITEETTPPSSDDTTDSGMQSDGGTGSSSDN